MDEEEEEEERVGRRGERWRSGCDQEGEGVGGGGGGGEWGSCEMRWGEKKSKQGEGWFSPCLATVLQR